MVIYRVSRKKCYLLIFLVNICHEAMYYTFLESLGIELQNKVDLKNVDPHKDELEDLKVSRMPESQYNHFFRAPQLNNRYKTYLSNTFSEP